MALVESLFASLASLVIGAVSGSLIAICIAVHAHDLPLTLCATAICLVSVVRIGSTMVHRRLRRAGNNPEVRRWEQLYGAGAWTFSALLGVQGFLTLVRTPDQTLHLLAVATAVGYAAGITGRNAGRPLIAVSQLSLSALPIAVALLIQPDLPHRALGVVIVLFVLGLLDITMQTFQVVLRAFLATREKAELAEALEEALVEANAASDAKTSFLTTMSHEIRTPLNGVLGMAQAMSAEALSPAQQARVEVIRRSGEALLSILNDVLDLAKVEAGKLEIEEIPFDLAEVAQNVHASFQAVAEQKGLAYELVIEQEARGAFIGDPTRLRQILQNLLSNAVKFTDAGSVRMRIGREGEAIAFTVSDTGIGIPSEKIETLFERFSQADASTTRRFGGTGLGLTICADLARLMGGRVLANSTPGVGSDFRLVLRLARVVEPETAQAGAGEAAANEEPLSERPVRLLCADDNEMNQRVIEALLQHLGISPVIVSDGAQAVEAWESQSFDAILMDVQMPVMDGPTATATIRAREVETGRARTPIIAVTANVMPHQALQYEAAGMDDLVAKPINVQALYEALQRALEGACESQPATAVA